MVKGLLAPPVAGEGRGGGKDFVLDLPTPPRETPTRFSTGQVAARALCVPPGTVKSRLHHARHELKEYLERSEP